MYVVERIEVKRRNNPGLKVGPIRAVKDQAIIREEVEWHLRTKTIAGTTIKTTETLRIKITETMNRETTILAIEIIIMTTAAIITVPITTTIQTAITINMAVETIYLNTTTVTFTNETTIIMTITITITITETTIKDKETEILVSNATTSKKMINSTTEIKIIVKAEKEKVNKETSTTRLIALTTTTMVRTQTIGTDTMIKERKPTKFLISTRKEKNPKSLRTSIRTISTIDLLCALLFLINLRSFLILFSFLKINKMLIIH